ncbi:AAA family ATPase [Microcoleus sp. FACHB-672]|uniref:AAA family ATPase n=1 Tax=Microcoleus sp. FACHB-672 TaxID=2692825 RepID=UPI0016825ACB|nr:AAA family ATPase [Microcoleus sp. FACHB-672]MBD2041526.1 AAA family ATPase [Microcoleus sp. FACHB-672]
MDAIRLKNLRNLEDTGFVQIKPITFLLGSNSSGKSTFLRFFPLIRQSAAARTIGPILWYGNLVDFGSFSEALNNKSSVNEISFMYKFRIPKFTNKERHPVWSRLYRAVPVIEDLDVILDLKMTTDEKRQGVTICKECSFQLADHRITIEMNASGDVVKFNVNENNFLAKGLKLKTEQTGSFLPQVFKVIDKREDIDTLFFYSSFYARSKTPLLLEELVETVSDLVHHKTKGERVRLLVSSFGIGSSKAMLADMKNADNGGETWNKKTDNWNENEHTYKYIRDLVIANSLILLLSCFDDYIANFARKISYIGPIRATAERYYRSQELAVGEVDSQGKNLAMFIRNLTKEEKKNFAKWTQEYFGFSLLVRSSGEHISLKIREENLQTEINLADTGFGFSQVLPILTQLWWLSRKLNSSYRSPHLITFTIEQPELHLHPKLQALFADSLIAAIKASKHSGIDLRLIIETHSETLINRFGHRIANKDFDREDINVVLFDRKKASDSVGIRVVSYDEEGFLTNWPLGFFEPDMI